MQSKLVKTCLRSGVYREFCSILLLLLLHLDVINSEFTAGMDGSSERTQLVYVSHFNLLRS